jgi:hypothetical protein
MTPENLLRSLTSYLGIDYVLTTTTDKQGSPRREHHLFAEPEIIQDVLKWSLRVDTREPVRIFEGSAPPF